MAGRLHPFTGLALAGTGAVACLAFPHWAVWTAALGAAAVLAARAGVGRRVAAAAAVVLVPFALWAFGIHGLFFPEGRAVLAELGPARVTAEGLAHAGRTVLRTAALVVVMLAFSAWADVPVLRAALVRRGVPAQLGYVLAGTLGLASTVGARLARIREAQEARGLVIGTAPGARIAAARLQAVPLVLALVEEAAERGTALEARGQGLPGPRTSYVAEPGTGLERAARWVLALSSAAVAAVAVAVEIGAVLGGAR
ncbi:energy-coupling factor transporter transmembrane component T [Sinomonas halotolerans]|uniref:Energy-coupling factor transporter transmembrane component T n=1 Tax=Sinomonas halotolerans TaxID=1644133 RepID=A0ABU9X2J7_9MICC